MIRTTALIALAAVPALAEPVVVHFDPNAPFDPAFDFVDLVDVDPTAPDIRLSYFAHDPGGGSNAEVWHPQIIGVGWTSFGGSGLEVESAVSSQGYLSSGGGSVPADIDGPWGVAEYDVFYGAGPDNYSLYRIGYEVFPFKDSCLLCSYVESFLTIDAGTYYIALRWVDNAQTYYGWAAFEVAYLDYPQSCSTNDPWACDGVDVDNYHQLGLRYIAAGYETEPGTPITVGGGLCPADLTFDANVNFFDISAFIDLYNDADPAADLDTNGQFNFFDISAFIDLYNAGCP